MTAVEHPEASTAATGLTAEEAARRLAERGPLAPPRSSRSYASIVRANVFTVFNLILAVFGVLMLSFGSWQDALFLGVLVSNSSIGIVQEVRAKRALDRLSALVVPTATVLRDGEPVNLPRGDVVVGDLVVLQPGDQLVADGHLETSESLLLDESILTGESDPVARVPGDELRSGAFVAEGTGRYTVTAVGDASYAARVTGEARTFRHPRSPLERAMNRLLYLLVAAMIPLGALLGYALWERQEPVSDAVTTAVAAVVTLVPEGLILLVSLTFAVAAIRMARRGALTQQLNALESLASVDVVCLDKTGTLTEADLRVVEVVPAGADPDPGKALAMFAASAGVRNTTLRAIAAGLPGESRSPEQEVSFSSRRRWSALRLDGTSYVLGAPEILPLGDLVARAEEESRAGRRVLAFARTTERLADGPTERVLPSRLEPVALVVLAERLRPHAVETVEFFRSEGVRLKVLSGDRPETVAAIAADVGIPVGEGALDGRELPADAVELQALLRERNVIGRISPDGKRRVIEALRDDGHYVAMVGDGVNDVPGLKAARLAIAQGSGVQMARSVADLVLVESDFEAVPSLVAEGRRILRNLQRVTKLFVAKAAFAAFLILSIGITPTAYPLLPRHLTLGASLAVGIPGFFLALAPSTGPFTLRGFLRGVFQFAAPAGAAVGFGVLSSYLAALEVFDLELIEARTVATTVMVVVGWYLILALEGSGTLRGAAVVTLCLVLAGLYVAVLLVPFARDFFALAQPTLGIVLIASGGVFVAIGGLVMTSDDFIPGRGTDRPLVARG
ncbi:MAG TPA: HAD-IC family P-type ATPase [Gaiella sp.]|uniref:HAD-IC family P-type ATPase n=1 Tax=Gaiella sp. TaxID=2663207 RepID=UPI002D7FC7E9|nr:HAD-IC family P-type ATPase [Gaiella sp.]HET9289319.1 HAD-IC family P-type ATPase [Gaiella sp.]